MSNQSQIPIKIFLGSPGDVAKERASCRAVVETLSRDPLVKDRVDLEMVAWESLPLDATMTPQEAINKGLPRPSECNIVVFIFWSRMGTPLPEEFKKPDGSRYASGTEWEFDDALAGNKSTNKKPSVLVYRRQEVSLNPDDLDFDEKVTQYKQLKEFFEGFSNPDGSIKHSYHSYKTPTDFKSLVNVHLRSVIRQIIDENNGNKDRPTANDTVHDEKSRWLQDGYTSLRNQELDAALYAFRRAEDTEQINYVMSLLHSREVERKVRLAEAYELQKEWEDAISVYKELLRDYPGDGEWNSLLNYVRSRAETQQLREESKELTKWARRDWVYGGKILVYTLTDVPSSDEYEEIVINDCKAILDTLPDGETLNLLFDFGQIPLHGLFGRLFNQGAFRILVPGNRVKAVALVSPGGLIFQFGRAIFYRTLATPGVEYFATRHDAVNYLKNQL